MAPTLSAQFCLGLCLCWGIWAQAGLFPRPSLRAEPGLVIPWGESVTLWCKGSPGTDLYLLKKEVKQNMEKSSDGRKAQVLISSMTAGTAGRYRCRYMKRSLWSEASDALELIVTLSVHPPSVLALPSVQVAPGKKVTFQCELQVGYDSSALHKDGEQIIHWGNKNNRWGAQTNFSIPSVTPAHGGTYRCYSFDSNKPYVWSAPSDTLVLRVTGRYRPSLRAEPGLVIPRGMPVTLWCEGSRGADKYILRKEREDLEMEKSADGGEAHVLIPYMEAETAGRYQCFYLKQSLWSQASDLLELRVSGLYVAPSLSAWPSSQVALGQEVTLQCQSDEWYDKSALYKDLEEILYGVAQYNGQGDQTNFSLPAVTPAQGGTYRCYSFDINKPYEWSAPSDPLVLRVTDIAPQDYTVGNVVRLLLAGLVFIILGILLIEACTCPRGAEKLPKVPMWP